MSGQDGKRDPDPRELAEMLEYEAETADQEQYPEWAATLRAAARALRDRRGRCKKHRDEPGPSLYFDCCEVERLRELIRAREAEVEELRAVKDGAYHERNQLVALLSANYPSQLQRHPDDDLEWEDDWRWIVFVQLPTGQASWHIHDDELPLFNHLPRDLPPIEWDGHTTPEKYERVIQASAQSTDLAALRERCRELEENLAEKKNAHTFSGALPGHGHFIKKCVCGKVLAQCRCPSTTKTVTIVHPCACEESRDA